MGTRIAVMSEGLLQQVGTPQVLYDQPANRFVAGFIGSPPINFFTATVSGSGAPALEREGFSLGLSPGLGARLEGFRGRTVQVGLRPEDLTAAAPDAEGGIPARVEVIEPLGNEVLVHWNTPVGTLVSRVTGEPAPKVGAEARLRFDESKLRFFDAQSEQAIATA